MTVSAIYDGSIRHRRYAERHDEFQHGIALAYVDLDELPSLLGGRLAGRGPKAVRFRRGDYLGDPAQPLSESVRSLVAARTGTRPEGPVRLLTHLRSFGHCFNPVSFYYCFDASGERLDAVVAEVTNTPWGERHAYALGRSAGDRSPLIRGQSDKALHVSPFMPMDQRYSWRVAPPAQTLSVHIENHRAGELAFDATLSLRRRELTPRTMAESTLRYPVATARVLALIYGHAAALKLKGLRVHPHPKETTA